MELDGRFHESRPKDATSVHRESVSAVSIHGKNLSCARPARKTLWGESDGVVGEVTNTRDFIDRVKTRFHVQDGIRATIIAVLKIIICRRSGRRRSFVGARLCSFAKKVAGCVGVMWRYRGNKQYQGYDLSLARHLGGVGRSYVRVKGGRAVGSIRFALLRPGDTWRRALFSSEAQGAGTTPRVTQDGISPGTRRTNAHVKHISLAQ